MYDDTSDESLSDTHFRQSEVDESNKKKRTRNMFNNFQLDELENAFDVTQYPDCYALYFLSNI